VSKKLVFYIKLILILVSSGY